LQHFFLSQNISSCEEELGSGATLKGMMGEIMPRIYNNLE